MTKSKDVIELEGKIVEALPNAQFRIQLETGQVILGHVSGKIRKHFIRILPGDKVRVDGDNYAVYILERAA